MEFLRALYGLEDESRRIQEYIEQNADAAISAISDKESMSLSAFYLSSDKSFIDEDLLPSYIARGLLEEKEGELFLTHLGEKAISAYPLLGMMRKDRRRFDLEFFPMLLSFLSSGDIPARSSQQQRFLSSEEFLSVFPQRDPDRVSRAAQKSISSMLKLSIAEENGNSLFLNRENALSFAAASEEAKISYMLYPDDSDEECRKKASYAISLALKLEGIRTDELDCYLDLIWRISGSRIDKETLLDFDVLRISDGYAGGADISFTETEDAVISSDFTLSYTGFTPTPLFMYFKAEKDDNIIQWKVTKESIKAAFDLGCSLKNVIYIMKGMSRQRPPKALIQRIEGWHEAYSALRISRATMLEMEDKSAKLIERLPDMQKYILSHPAPTVFIMDHSKEEEWRQNLIGYGFDMIGRTSGPAFYEKSRNRRFISYKSSIQLPDSRAIGFSRSRCNELIASSGSFLDRILTEEGIRFLPEQHFMPAMTSGFNYYEKLSLIISAMKRKSRIYAELTDGRELIFTPAEISKEESGDHMILTAKGNRIPVCILYRTAAVDSIIRDQV